MNSEVSPLTVALVLALTAVALTIWMWGSGAAASIGGPAELGTDPDGHAYVQIQHYLVEHDANGNYVKTHDLSNIGVDVSLGGFDFFSNGDILLRLGPDPRSFGDNFRAFQRKANENSIVPEDNRSGLFRCNLDRQACSRFGGRGVDFKAAYGVHIDRENDEVYVSDTTRHVLRKYSAAGDSIGGPITGFKFPNQILVHEDKLFVVDTNNHVVRVLQHETKHFGDDIDRVSVVPSLAEADLQRWPSRLARVGHEWWVNNMRTGMNQGGVYLFDDSWRLIRKLNTGDGADPIAILPFGDDVWVSDWYNDKVHRFSPDGESLSDLQSEGLEKILERSRSERRKYEMISYSGVALILLLLGGLLVRGLVLGMAKGSR